MNNQILIYSHELHHIGTIFTIFPAVFQNCTLDIERAKFHSSSVLFLSFNLIKQPSPALFKYFEIYNHRKSNGLPTKIIIDYSLEGICSTIECEILFKEHNIKFEDVLFVNNTLVANQFPDYDFKQHITFDHHSLDAYSKCIFTAKNRVDSTLVKDRPNALNLLIGKLKTKYSRFLTSYYFYKCDLLDNSVLGIHASPEDILNMMKLHPEYDDINFYNKIITCLGPADSVSIIQETNEGLTATAGGWPFDPAIFKNSSISYVCETYDIDKGNFPYLLTEKTYRAIINKHPFVIQSSPGQLNSVKSLGYETFSSIIDETYNEYTALDYSHVEKTVLAAKDFVHKLPNNLDKVQEIVDYNYKHWLTSSKTEYDKTLVYLNNFINNI